MEENASLEEAKKAYKKIAFDNHPDRHQGDKEAEERFKEASLAFDMIKNPQNHRKAAQQQSGPIPNVADWFRHQQQRWNPFGRQQPAESVYHVQAHQTFRENCMGGQKELSYNASTPCTECNSVGATTGNYQTCQTCEGSGMRTANGRGFQWMSITCEPCGGKGLLITTPCGTCRGAGQTNKKKTLKIDLPPCMRQGVNHQVEADDGDVLLLQVVVAPEPAMQRPDGTADIHSRAEISLKDALLGCKIPVQTLHGEKIMSLRECTVPGTRAKLKGLGAKIPNKDAHGNHIVHVEIKFPDSLTSEQRKAIETMFDQTVSEGTGARKDDDTAINV